jgi:hypothetical protein
MMRRRTAGDVKLTRHSMPSTTTRSLACPTRNGHTTLSVKPPIYRELTSPGAHLVRRRGQGLRKTARSKASQRRSDGVISEVVTNTMVVMVITQHY